jgi:glycosyltransferase involved in cell wall biosynthesis
MTEPCSKTTRQRRLAVGLVGPLPPPPGGIANQTKQLARLLSESGANVELVQMNAPYRPHWVSSVRGLRAVVRLVPYVVRLWRCAGRVDLLHIMANSGWAWHLLAAPAVWVAWLRNKPVVVNYRGGEAEAFFKRQFRLVAPTLSRAAAVVVPSGFLRDVFGRYGVRAEVVPNVVDLTRFRPGLKTSSGSKIIVTRNLEDIYDIPTALRAFAKIRAAVPSARLTVAGSGPQFAACQRLCRELEIEGSVVFTGRLDNEEIPELYSGADLLLNASLVDNTPISLLEAMASGVPIVSTSAGGIPHLVKDGVTARLVAPRDVDALASAALWVLRNPNQAQSMAAAGLEYVREFTWERVRPRLFAVYADAVGTNSLHPLEA